MAESQPTEVEGIQLAALDLGSNSFHLIVATENKNRLTVIDRLKDMVRLADGLDANNQLDEKVAKRALACLERYGQRLRSLHPDHVRIVGTNTLREAQKSGDFVKRAEQALGHKVEIISGREEARLIFLGVAHAIEETEQHRLVVDIGGGSTELVIGSSFNPIKMVSLQLGCVSLSQTHFKDGQINKASYLAALNHARQELEPFAHDFKTGSWDSAIGASGTILAVSGVQNALTGTTGDITKKGISDIRSLLLKAKNSKDLSVPTLSPERQEVFHGGLAILQAIFETFEIDTMRATQGALREGLLHDLLGRVYRQDIRETSVADAASRFNVDVRHAARVRDTALALLAQVAGKWELAAPHYQQLLSWCATLHEIGMDISHSQYHKHSGYLLRHMELAGFSDLDQSQLATIVRSHRRKLAKDEGVLAVSDNTALVRLTVLLRLAVVLRRNRGNEPLPYIGVEVKTAEITLILPTGWLDEHPLTELDLAQEATYLEAIPTKLKIKKQTS